MVEALFGMSAIGSTISRTRRQMLEALSNSARDVPFVVEDIVAILTVTDENEKAIMASVNSHYAAAKPNVPFRVVLVAERADSSLTKAFEELRRTHTNLLLFLKEELARQARTFSPLFSCMRVCLSENGTRFVASISLLPGARCSSCALSLLALIVCHEGACTQPSHSPQEYVLNADDEEAQAALNVVLEDNMYLGQVIFYSLDRLFLQYGHAISNACIVIMPASSIVDSEVIPSTPASLLLPPYV
jgi:hypothetical protein